MKLNLSFLPVWQLAPAARVAMNYSLRVSHAVFSLVGIVSIVTAAALWWRPQWRDGLAASLASVPAVATQAELALTGPFDALAPPYAPGFRRGESANPFAQLGLISSENELGSIFHARLPSAAPLARKIPIQRIVAEARDDFVLASHQAQIRVTRFLARRYGVAKKPIAHLVQASFVTGREVGLDPLLLLAVMAIESRFNPYAESRMGAQGLMQVMSKVHADKLKHFGGLSAALQPLANIKVGALILKDCIARGGSLANGLRLYNGSTSHDNSYSTKVLAERERLRNRAAGSGAFFS